MKHLKLLSLFAMAAASLIAFAGSAPAATFTSPAGTAYLGKFDATLEGSTLLKAGFAEITCTSDTIGGEWTTNNETEASGPIDAFSLSGCKEGQTVTTLNPKGTLTILKSNTAVTATGVEWTTAVAGVSCVYGFGSTATSLGTATNSGSGSTAKVTLAVAAKLPKISGGFLCASPASWTGSLIFTTPTPSVVD
jgi:hypothetical protein